MYLPIQTIHNSINLQGMKQQAQFALGLKGGMKGCEHNGMEITTPLQHNLKGVDLSGALLVRKVFSGEIKSRDLFWYDYNS